MTQSKPVTTRREKPMQESRFWELVKVNKPYGKYYSAFITCNGYDYNAAEDFCRCPACQDIVDGKNL